MVTQLPLPDFLGRTISSLGNCTTATTMIFIGTVLADAGIRHMISKLTMMYSGIRLIAIPAAVMAACLLFHIESVPAGVSVVLAAMPMGSTTAIFASKYHGDEAFATQCIVLSTLLSMAVLPVWCMVLNSFFV